MARFVKLAVVLMAVSVPCVAQSHDAKRLERLAFLTGEWVGEGNGQPGQGSGAFTFNFDLQGKVQVRRNFAEYPASNDKPAFRHDDLMVVYEDSGGKGIRAIYFDNEGHVINYAVALSSDMNTVTFLSESLPGTPRYRLTYTKTGGDSLTLQFDIAPPGRPDAFTKYIEAKLHKKSART